jgi:hypothetical protein
MAFGLVDSSLVWGAPHLKNQKHQAQDTATMRHAMPTPGTDKAVDLQRGKAHHFLLKNAFSARITCVSSY